MKQDTLVRLLNEMAEIVDGPNGPGGGAILHEAASEIADLKRQLRESQRMPEPTTP